MWLLSNVCVLLVCGFACVVVWCVRVADVVFMLCVVRARVVLS